MTSQIRREPGVPAPAPQRTAATHASRAHEFSYRFLKDVNITRKDKVLEIAV